jgi:hypothetical protein
MGNYNVQDLLQDQITPVALYLDHIFTGIGVGLTHVDSKHFIYRCPARRINNTAIVHAMAYEISGRIFLAGYKNF